MPKVKYVGENGMKLKENLLYFLENNLAEKLILHTHHTGGSQMSETTYIEQDTLRGLARILNELERCHRPVVAMVEQCKIIVFDANYIEYFTVLAEAYENALKAAAAKYPDSAKIELPTIEIVVQVNLRDPRKIKSES